MYTGAPYFSAISALKTGADLGLHFLGLLFTVWKFLNFSIMRILREIKIGNSRSAKFAILTHSELLNFDYDDFLHFLKAEI